MRTALDRAVAELLEVEESRPLTTADLREQARISGYSVKQIQRKLSEKQAPESQDVEARFAVGGSSLTVVCRRGGCGLRCLQVTAAHDVVDQDVVGPAML